MKKYKSGAIALDLVSTDPQRLYSHTRRLVPTEHIYLIHVVRMNGCVPDADFEPSRLEQEYWRCEAQLRDCGVKLNVPLEHQILMVGDVIKSVREFIQKHGIGLLVFGTQEDQDLPIHPTDLISGALTISNCDLLMVR